MKMSENSSPCMYNVHNGSVCTQLMFSCLHISGIISIMAVRRFFSIYFLHISDFINQVMPVSISV